jgi:hypothetical protein
MDSSGNCRSRKIRWTLRRSKQATHQ